MFNYINTSTWERSEHFDYYRSKVVCGYCCTVRLDVTNLINELKKKSLRFYPSFIYCTAKIVNSMKEFRMGIDKNGLPGYFDVSHPNITIFHEDDHTFSDMWSEYNDDFMSFYTNTVNNMEKYKDKKGIKARDNQPANFFCISCIPWLSYTAYSTYATQDEPNLFPVITFGKITETDGVSEIPFTINISHAAADGYHTSKFINMLQEYINNFTV